MFPFSAMRRVECGTWVSVQQYRRPDLGNRAVCAGCFGNGSEHARSKRQGRSVLTLREDQVVSLLAEGISNREIAEQFSITENTVEKSLLRIYDKLGVSNRVELVLSALTHRDKYCSTTAAAKLVFGRLLIVTSGMICAK
jgi:DNA-binding CsgD family transcriptional regulator